ncbi:hypothetical protein GGR50DRAFT_684391 [Xylaria sp. CBS 124048]|nr:hypothetical protein GGR50DRAFT_684391 [Xylaria sp. CBS 124048]
MILRHAVIQKVRAPYSIPSLKRTRASFARKSASAPRPFANLPLPSVSLFDEPGVSTSVLRPSGTDERRGARVLLVSYTKRALDPFRPALVPRGSIGDRMLSFVQIITIPTADSPGTALLLHFDNRRYILGQISEGTQRALAQRKIGIVKAEDIFLTGPVSSQTCGGLMGLILTLADVLSMSKENIKANNIAKNRLIRLENMPPSRLNIYGGKNLSHYLAVSRRFILRQGLPLRVHETTDNPPRSSEPEPDWKDSNIKVWYIPVESDQDPTASNPRKRSHDEFSDVKTTSMSPAPSEAEDRNVVETVVKQMFDSNWKADALVETTLYRAYQTHPAAKLFVRNEKGHLQEYKGPRGTPGSGVPDISVLVRQPWPGALFPQLPVTQPSKQSMCYIVKGHDRRGRFNAKAAESLGVINTDFKKLTNMQTVTTADGTVVTPDMVLGESVPGAGFAVVDLPDASYINALVNRVEWSNSHIMKGIKIIFWILGRDVVGDARLQSFMKKMSAIEHIVSSPDVCPNMLAFESPATQAYKLRCVDADRFPLPHYSNETSLSGVALTKSDLYEAGRPGKTIQYAPDYVHVDEKTVPFADIPKLAEIDNYKDALRLGVQAKETISRPEFLAAIEEAEADIPNRDAEIITLGTGSALPSKYRNCSGTLVRVPGVGSYLFDVGEGTMGQIRRVFGPELPSVLRDLKAIWISHLHADHHLGTVSVIKAWHEETKKSNPSARLMVGSHTHMIDFLREYACVEDYGFERLVLMPFNKKDDPFSPSQRRVLTPEQTQEFGLESIAICWVFHCHGAMATVFTWPSGFKVAYSGDCRPSEDFAQIGRGATVLIHESTFDDELIGDAVAKRHSTMSEAIGIGRKMGARRILLTHFSQRYQKVPLLEDGFQIDAESAKKEVVLVAFDYMRIKVGDFRKAQAFLPAVQALLEQGE